MLVLPQVRADRDGLDVGTSSADAAKPGHGAAQGDSVNRPERRRVVAFAAFGWLVSIVVGYRQREDIYSVAVNVSWARARVEA